MQYAIKVSLLQKCCEWTAAAISGLTDVKKRHKLGINKMTVISKMRGSKYESSE